VEGCPFCARIATDDVAWAGEAAVAFADAYPVAPGHTLVCPRRHVEDLFALADDEYTAVWALVRAVQRDLAERTDAAGWNVGATWGQPPARRSLTPTCM
jgi:diadenosine tetraphosphate (Ap4A) HIT family hydrolase